MGLHQAFPELAVVGHEEVQKFAWTITYSQTRSSIAISLYYW